MSVPTLEKAVESIEILNNLKSGNIIEASNFLIDLQKSSFAWIIADQLLYMNKDLYSSYFGAQTMRTKIQLHFEELPVDSHLSLKESLMKHLLEANGNINGTVTKQLCLAVADLYCHMVLWPNSLQEIIYTLSQNTESVYLLLDVLKYIPEEYCNKSLRLGVNRKEQIYGELEDSRLTVLSILDRSLTLQTDIVYIAAFDCLNAWYALKIFRDNDLQQSLLISLVYQVLEKSNETNENLFKSAVQCATDFFAFNIYRVPNLAHIFQERTYLLEQAYHICETSRPDYCLEYAKIFCEMATALLPDVLSCPTFNNSCDIYDVRTLQLLVMIARTNRECCSYAMDVLIDVTSNNSSSCSEDNLSRLALIFEEFISVMTRHCAKFDVKEESSLTDFRADVFFFMEQMRMFVDTESLFKKMLTNLSQLLIQGDNTQVYNEAEAVLCMISSLVKSVDTDSPENASWTEQLLITVILPNIGRSQPTFKSVCFKLFSELCWWSLGRLHIMECMVNEMATFVIDYSLDEHDELQMNALTTAIHALAVFCKKHPSYMIQVKQWGLIYEVCNRLPRFSFVMINEMTEIYESIGKTICTLAMEDKDSNTTMDLAQKLWQICQINVEVVNNFNGKSDLLTNWSHPSNPCLWLDNVSAVFLSMSKVTTVTNSVIDSLYAVIYQYLWPIISQLIERYIGDGHVLERVVRILRYVLRSFKRLTKPMLGQIAAVIITAYGISHESCFIYIAGILVDEFGEDDDCRQGLLQIFQSISTVALTILQGDGLLKDPHTAEDFFRLTVRLVQHCASVFLSQPQLQLAQLLDMALRTLSASSMKIDTKMLALRFLLETLESANDAAQDAFKNRMISWLLQENGLLEILLSTLHLCRWHSEEVIDEDLASDMALVVISVRKLVIDESIFLSSVDNALLQVGFSRQDGLLYVTDKQRIQFREGLLQDKRVQRAIEDFAQLFT